MLIYTGANTIFNHEYKKELQELISKEEQIAKIPKFRNPRKKTK